MPIPFTEPAICLYAGRGGFRGVDWVASRTPSYEKGCDYYGRNKGEHSGQIPHCYYK